MRMGVQLPVAKVEVYTQSGQLGFAVDSGKGGGSSFIYLAGQRIAEDHWNCANNTHTASYFHSDALGSPVATTDAARNVLERTYYAPYGEALNRSVDGPGYTGHVMDAATGLVYAQQRYYDPLVGKFLSILSIDPVAANPGTGGNFNRYWYANDNPYKFTDPDGRAPPGCGDGICERPPPAPITLPPVTVTSTSLPPPPPTLGTITVTAPWPLELPKIPVLPIGEILGALSRPALPILLVGYPASLGAAACELPGGPSCGIDVIYSKGGKQNVRDTGLIGVSDEKIGRRLRDPTTSGKEKQRLQKEQKARGSRNKGKREENR